MRERDCFQLLGELCMAVDGALRQGPEQGCFGSSQPKVPSSCCTSQLCIVHVHEIIQEHFNCLLPLSQSPQPHITAVPSPI